MPAFSSLCHTHRWQQLLAQCATSTTAGPPGDATLLGRIHEATVPSRNRPEAETMLSICSAGGRRGERYCHCPVSSVGRDRRPSRAR